MVRVSGLNVDRLRADVMTLGDSIVVAEVGDTVKLQVHTADLASLLAFAQSIGELEQASIENMSLQTRDRVLGLTADPKPKEPAARGMCDVVAVATGAGIAAAMRSLGASKIVAGGQSMNPSVAELLDAIEATTAPEAVLLPGNSNIILTAEQAARLASKPVVVVASRTAPQTLAALEAFRPDQSAAANAKRMNTRLSSVRTAELTRSIREAMTAGLEIIAGDFVVLVDETLVAAGDDLVQVLAKGLQIAGAESAELITAFVGNLLTDEESARLREIVATTAPDAQIEWLPGGQPHYLLIIGLSQVSDGKQQRVTIVTDSTCDLPVDLREQWNITVVPLDVRFGNEVFQNGVDISPAEFMIRLVNERVIPSTSQPPPGRVEDVFRDLARDHDAIIAVLLSAQQSGTVNSAATAAAAVAELIPVEIVDSRSGAMGLGLQAIRAAELAATGLFAIQIAETLRRETERCQVIFFVDTLDDIQRGGRIGRAAALIGSVLQQKLLLRVEDGLIVPWNRNRNRTRVRAIASLVEFANGIAPVNRVAALYSTDRGAGEALADRLASELTMPRGQVLVCQIGATVASHIGPDVMGVVAIERGT